MKGTKSIFLVEDDKDDQNFFIDCIEKIENATLYGVAGNGRLALDKLENSTALPDMIFMDINMPVMNGIECLTEIIKSPHLKNIPVVILSSDSGEAQLAGKLGAKAFIKKPADCEILQTKVEQIINLDFISNASFANRTFQTAIYAK